VAYGQLGMTAAEFDACSPAYLMRRIAGFTSLQERHSRERWVIARWQTATLINMNGKQLRQYIEPEQLVRFNWEAEEIKWTDELIEICNQLFPHTFKAQA